MARATSAKPAKSVKPAKKATEKSVVAITQGGRWEAKKVLKDGFDLLGGIKNFVKKGDVVILKPNLGYPEPEGMPAWTCTTDVAVLVALTELCFEAGAKRVITGDAVAHEIKSSYMFESTGVKEGVEKVGGEVSYFEEEPNITVDIPGGILLKKQAVPKPILDADVIFNVPKIKPTRVGKWTLGFKNMFGLVPHEERLPWHRIPEHFYLLTDLYRRFTPTLTIMDGLVIQEGEGPRFGTPVDLGVIVMVTDPVATEAVTVSVIGHEPYEQMILPIAEKYGLGTMDFNKIEVRGKSIESVRRYTKVAPGDWWLNTSPNVVEYPGGACWGCGLWVQYTPYPWEIDKNKKYALVFGNTPRLPEQFTEDEVWIMGSCAIREKERIKKACPPGVTPTIVTGCPPYGHRRPGYLKLHKIDHLPYSHGTNYAKKKK